MQRQLAGCGLFEKKGHKMHICRSCAAEHCRGACNLGWDCHFKPHKPGSRKRVKADRLALQHYQWTKKTVKTQD